MFNTCCSTSLYYVHAYTHLFAYLSLFLCIISMYNIYIYIYIWSVVWNMFYFSIYWEYYSQLTFIFFRGVAQPPTSIYIYICVHTIHPCAHMSPPFLSKSLGASDWTSKVLEKSWILGCCRSKTFAPQSPIFCVLIF